MSVITFLCLEQLKFLGFAESHFGVSLVTFKGCVNRVLRTACWRPYVPMGWDGRHSKVWPHLGATEISGNTEHSGGQPSSVSFMYSGFCWRGGKHAPLSYLRRQPKPDPFLHRRPLFPSFCQSVTNTEACWEGITNVSAHIVLRSPPWGLESWSGLVLFTSSRQRME